MHYKYERQFGLNNVQEQRKMTLPTSKSGAHSKQGEMVTLITGSTFCHCRACLFVYVISLQGSNLDLYLQALTQIVPGIFALYQPRYFRWLSLRICDMMSLLMNHPNIRAEFHARKMVVPKTNSKFSLINGHIPMS